VPEWHAQPWIIRVCASDDSAARICPLLLTDLKSFFQIGTDIDFEEMLQLGYFRHDEPEAYYLLKINPIINRILELTSIQSLSKFGPIFTRR
jgi:hypothetical protein